MQHNSKILAIFFSFIFLNLANAQGITPVGGGGGSGTVTSIATSCGLSGGPITTTGTIQGSATPNAQTGTSYAIQNSDCGKLITFSNTSAIGVTIAQAGGSGNFASGWFTTIINEGVGVVTITPSTSTVDGDASIVLYKNQSIDLFSDGSNYFTARGVVTTAPSGVYRASNWYIAGGEMMAAPASNGNLNNGTVSCYPFYFRFAGRTIDRLGAIVNTTSAGGNYSVALYANNPATNRPTGTVLADSGSMSTTSGGAVNGTVSLTVSSAAWLWACANSDNGTASLRGSSFMQMSGFMGSATQANLSATGASALSGVTTPLAYASGWTDLTGATWTEVQTRNWPLVQFRLQ